ncbi:hypothetical protein BH23DEI1_BH23DEI1_19830 [soil metagenome]
MRQISQTWEEPDVRSDAGRLTSLSFSEKLLDSSLR